MSSGSPAVSTGDEVLVTLAGDPQAFRPTVTGGLAFSVFSICYTWFDAKSRKKCRGGPIPGGDTSCAALSAVCGPHGYRSAWWRCPRGRGVSGRSGGPLLLPGDGWRRCGAACGDRGPPLKEGPVPPHKLPYSLPSHGCALPVGEEEGPLRLHLLQVELEHLPRIRSDGHHPLLRALARGDEKACLQVDIALLQGDQLGYPKACRVQQLKDRGVPQGELLVSGELEKLDHLFLAQHPRDGGLESRGLYFEEGVALYLAVPQGGICRSSVWRR